MKKTFTFKPKQHIRNGQELFNFLEWLHTNKGIETNQSSRLADTFHTDDKTFNKHLTEYNKNKVEEKKEEEEQISINDISHPIRKLANEIIENIIEPFTGDINEENYYDIEDKITYTINDKLINYY